jgi:hypothetical protein
VFPWNFTLDANHRKQAIDFDKLAMLTGYKHHRSARSLSLSKRAMVSLKLVCLAYGCIAPAFSDKRSETPESEEDMAFRSKRRPENDRTKRKMPKRKFMRAKSAEEEDTDGRSTSDIERHAVNAGLAFSGMFQASSRKTNNKQKTR